MSIGLQMVVDRLKITLNFTKCEIIFISMKKSSTLDRNSLSSDRRRETKHQFRLIEIILSELLTFDCMFHVWFSEIKEKSIWLLSLIQKVVQIISAASRSAQNYGIKKWTKILNHFISTKRKKIQKEFEVVAPWREPDEKMVYEIKLWSTCWKKRRTEHKKRKKRHKTTLLIFFFRAMNIVFDVTTKMLWIIWLNN